MPRFVDTNVVLYAVSTARAETAKRDKAREILRATDLALSAQVLGEFYVQTTRTSREGALSHADAVAMIESLGRFPIEPVTTKIVSSALATRERYQISYWDAAIIEAARTAKCTEVLSEDLSSGQDYDGVVVRNPFE
ncbi:twitching motility protein PilT [Microlunatus endophyticus]|uniref:Twitching motility protein PilT n=1 Tax=Microlunatus endophyticus TaxID=1716077 RepID=A0A917SAT4_9ACTN|nr:PIN domain-containing protein [Microlunatus endophyticus]GGL68234.1 twitching motility protein PilT [Microlunatus endophyticus]